MTLRRGKIRLSTPLRDAVYKEIVNVFQYGLEVDKMLFQINCAQQTTKIINRSNNSLKLSFLESFAIKVGQRLRDVSTAMKYSFKPILLETLFCPATVIRYLFYVTRVHVIKDKNV